ncbi:FAD-binding PCMH-type domain-containing protein [Trichostrongylus colubriformis]|uniref:FAD-binding PCMH-type domain-containing protein n=1 Tax=Trichostrongylus colubriformis TaxID=6319 RepID=A0AAN8FC75_TRICO
MELSVLRFNVNGKDIHAANIDPETTLASYLRNHLGLTGTKLGCEEGACGACTVVIGAWDDRWKKARYSAVNACLLPLYMAHHCLVLTVEGIGSPKKIHPIQDRLARGHGTQCGFCSPGFVMSAYALLRTNPSPTIHEIDQAVKGNLCRCTGYRPILEALYSFGGKGCCNGLNSTACPCKENGGSVDQEKLITFDDFPKFDETQEILFPPSLIMEKSANDLYLEGPRVKLIVPVSWRAVDDLFRLNDDVTIVSSGQFTRLQTAQSPNQCATWVSVHNLPSMRAVETTETEVSIGAAISISEFVKTFEEYCDASVSVPIRKLFDKYSSMQAMNVASWVGGLLIGASEITSVFLAFNPKVAIRELGGAFTTARISDLIDEQGRMKLNRGAVIVGATFQRCEKHTRVFTFKQGLRPGADSTVVNCVGVFRVEHFIETARIAVSFGSNAVLSEKVSQRLRGK